MATKKSRLVGLGRRAKPQARTEILLGVFVSLQAKHPFFFLVA